MPLLPTTFDHDTIYVNAGGGPVWFARRPDSNFLEWMSQWMDRQVVGAIGGNIFRKFRIVLDYPGRSATFCR